MDQSELLSFWLLELVYRTSIESLPVQHSQEWFSGDHNSRLQLNTVRKLPFIPVQENLLPRAPRIPESPDAKAPNTPASCLFSCSLGRLPILEPRATSAESRSPRVATFMIK
jgi:hypothetical protein